MFANARRTYESGTKAAPSGRELEAAALFKAARQMEACRRDWDAPGRSQPKFIVAAVCGVASYALMNLMMTSAPLAMFDCGHSVTDASLGIQWHVLAMYAPSFFIGSLILRFGVAPVTAVGLLILGLSAIVGLSGITVAHFWTALILLGVGWNFAFVGATTMVCDCHRPEERNKVQAFNDFLIFGSMAIGSFASGSMLAHYGWYLVNVVMLPVVAVSGALLIWLTLRERTRMA